MTDRNEQDKKKILDHVHSIFDAFVRQDRPALRDSHAEDWLGFMVSSTGIERGIEAYMANAEKSLQSFKGKSYELLDHEIQISSDLALVFYVARYDYEDADANLHSLPLRCIDIYRRDGDGWIQAGSHITVVPSQSASDVGGQQ
jgi:ketosteroid isomerase-like protein